MLGQYISELLFKYNTVIIPGFGAFILQYSPSIIKQVEQKITPPSKHVLFNPSINNNDGILANYISEKEKISFFDACNKILAFIGEIKNTISEGKQFKLEKIGIFFKNQNNSISFIPDNSINYDIETYGFEEIECMPILRNDIKERLQKQFAEKHRTIKGKKIFPKTAIWVISLIIFICIAVLFFTINYVNYRGETKQSNIAISQKTNINKQEQEKKQLLAKKYTSVIDTVKKDTSKENKLSAEKNQSSDILYYIISGSFRLKENANNYAEKLRKKSYNSSVIFLNEKGLYAVSCNSYLSQQEAEHALLSIKTECPEAWILKQ